MKKQMTSQEEEEEERRTKENRRKLAKAAEKAGGSLEHVETPGWETSKSAGKSVHDSRRSKDHFVATVRAIPRDNKDADPDHVLRDVTEAIEAVREDYLEKNNPHENSPTGRPGDRPTAAKTAL